MKFYVIDKRQSGDQLRESYRTDFYYDDKVNKGDAPRCPKCTAFVGMLMSFPPYLVRLETLGIGFGDLAFWMDDFLVTRRFQEAYDSYGLRGLSEFVPVKVLSCKKHRKLREDMPSYFRTMPNRGSATIDPVASKIEWGEPKNPRCEVCLSGDGVLKRWKSVVVDESTWNGDDIFYAYGLPGTLIVSSRFADWAKEQNFRNLILVDAQSSSHDFYPMESCTEPVPYT